ncbi:electron transfer flavoprotein subunit alpha/FixB family protein [Stackebrandtia nassauensis]|uniref:Electron transfer flavoprotein alpha subunit n=1 Tax=Stackebrandtia nassauensis (strain DSM 44728 / CIP 108903 / NRRL B-16338 / NBRC 102104 / LLR-40K-21) TaxID=446470 RepID=D3PYF3_STANL|nr:electron transfer flavoprotein subunit alpha/FixB family protein [Stackebrandtia nassauensis]ADD41520.1 Electron transfer flavoprotein alpha subunit [Stackebrandtia nassauensis DSM 44728]
MILTFVEHDGRRPTAASLTALTVARGLGEPAAVCFTDPADAAPLLAELAAYGAATVHLVDGAGEYSPERWGAALSQLIGDVRPGVVVAPASDRGNEVAAQAAARARLPLATGCVEVAADGTVTRVRGGGILLEDAAVDAGTRMVTVLPTAAEAHQAPRPGEAVPHTFVPDLDGIAATRLVDRAPRGAGVALATAPVVVSGGRGVGSAEGFAPLEELAALIGGAVGCSRVATNNGWRPHSDQVGQTGTKVNPRLYIACGISGATQHWVGCMDSKAILAINTDPDAPMVTRASYAVIGDVHEVLDAVIQEVRRRKAQ